MRQTVDEPEEEKRRAVLLLAGWRAQASFA
jgi:hypothetical protein